MQENHHNGGGSRLSTEGTRVSHGWDAGGTLMDNRRTAAVCDDAHDALTRIREAGHTATLAVHAEACGAMGCRLTEPLIRATVADTTRTLCTDHALDFAEVGGGH